MRIATFNVNGVNGRLPVLLRWLEKAKPDIVCLQELKAPQGNFPEAAIRDASYGAVWHGQKSWNGVAILARGTTPVETRCGLPGRCRRRAKSIHRGGGQWRADRVPVPSERQPGARSEVHYKLRWFERLATHAAELLASEAPVVLAGDFNVMPTDLDVYKPERWLDDALFRPEVRDAFHRLIELGWVDAIRKLHPHERIDTFWDYFRNAWGRDAGLRIDHLLLNPQLENASLLQVSIARCGAGEKARHHVPARTVPQIVRLRRQRLGAPGRSSQL